MSNDHAPLSDAERVAFMAGWNARETGSGHRADGRESCLGMFERGFNFGDSDTGEVITRQAPAAKPGPPRFLKAECGVRYWEDSTVDGVEDEDGTLIPLRSGDTWAPTIDLVTGTIVFWPAGVAAEVHYKVCDDGSYSLLDSAGTQLCKVDGYVPPILSPGRYSGSDYVILSIGGDGRIANWAANLDYFDEALARAGAAT